MKRKIIGAAAAYMSGLFFASFFKEEYFILILPFSALFAIFGRIKNFKLIDFSVISFSFAVAMLAVTYQDSVYSQIVFFDGTKGYFSGTVTDITRYNEENASYIIKGSLNGIENVKISFYWKDYGLKYGDRINIKNCSFSKIKGDYLFDSENWYKSEKVYLKASGEADFARTNSQKLRNFLSEYKEKMISDFRIVMGDDYGYFLSGMVFGEKQGLDENIKNSLYKSGIGHILAVSGLHVSVSVFVIMAILERIRMNKFISFILVNIFMFLLVMTADVPLSAVRASLMFDFAYSAKLFRRQNDTFNSLACAVLIICMANPYVIYSNGFLLSVCGTFGAGVFAPYMTKNVKRDTFKGKILYSFANALFTAVFIMPLSINFFDEVSVLSPLMNVLLLPLCTSAMLIGMLYVLTGGIIPLLRIAVLLIKPVIYFSEKVSEEKFFRISGNSLQKSIVMSMFFGCIAVYFISRNRKVLLFSLSLCISAFLMSDCIIDRNNRENVNIAVLGKDNNAVVLVSYRDNVNVIDLNGHFRSAEYAVKYLGSKGIDSIDTLFLPKKVQSEYSVYMKEFQSIHKNKIFIGGKIPVSRKEDEVVFGDGFEAFSGIYHMKYENDVLTISVNDLNICFAPAKSGGESENLTVFYGNIPQNSEIIRGNIYLDGKEYDSYEYSDMNNFEIIVSGNRCTLRRL